MAEGMKKMFTSHKILLATGIIVVGILAVAGLAIKWVRSPQPSSLIQSYYPTSAGAIPWTTDVTRSANGTQLLIPYKLVVEKKLVFFDVKLQTTQLKLRPPYPMPTYRDGEYLPMLILATPSGRLVSAVRTCEPCGSFLFYTDGEGKLVCNTCKTTWSLETLKVLDDRGCGDFPPYELPTKRIGDDIVIDISILVGCPIQEDSCCL